MATSSVLPQESQVDLTGYNPRRRFGGVTGNSYGPRMFGAAQQPATSTGAEDVAVESGVTGGGQRTTFSGVTPAQGLQAQPNGFDIGSYISSNDPGKMAEMDRKLGIVTGTNMQNDFQNYGQRQGEIGEGYRQAGDQIYGNILNGGGGYTDAEKEGILRTGEYNGLKYDESQNPYLSSWDEDQIRGDPNKALKWFDPAYTDQIAGDTTQFTRDQLYGGRDKVNSALSDSASAQRGAVDSTALSMDPNAAAKMQGAVDSTAAGVRGAIDPSVLNVSSDFLSKYPMSDAERQGYVDRAARQVGGQYAAAQQQMAIDQAQAGNSSPQAMAAARGRLLQQSAVDSADARANAELQAQAAQRETLNTAEQTRLGAASNYAGLRSNAEMSIGEQARQNAQNTESMRLSAANNLTGYRTQQENQIANQNINAAQGQQALGVQTEQNLGNVRQQANQANQQTGIAAYQQADQAASDRAAQVATNHQNTTQYGQQMKYNTGMGVAQAQTANNLAVANENQNQRREARGWITGQNQQASNNVNQANEQRLNAYGTMMNSANNATRNEQSYQLGKSGQGWGAVAKGIVGNVASKAAGGFFGGN